MHLARVAELAAVVEHPVEARLGAERLERQPSSVGRGRLGGLRLGEQVVLGGEDVALVVDLAARARGRAGPPSRRRSPSRCGTDGRNTDAVSPRSRARTKRPTAWAKNSGVEVVVA